MRTIVAVAITLLLVSSNAYALGVDGMPQGVMCEIKKITVLAKSEKDCLAIGGKVMFVIQTEEEKK